MSLSSIDAIFPLRIADISHHSGQIIETAGYIHHIRNLGGVIFVLLRDATGIVQIVTREPLSSPLKPETTVLVRAQVHQESRAPGGFELIRPRFTILSEPQMARPYDLTHPLEDTHLKFRLDVAPFMLRHPHWRKVFQMASQSVQAFRHALINAGFVEIHTPKIVGTATESGAAVFPVQYYGKEAFLAQSPQFYKQILCGVFDRVYEVGPVFRAEPHDTVRHLSQYTSLDAEMAYIRDHHDVMRVLTIVIQEMVEAVSPHLDSSQRPWLPDEIPVISFREALSRLSQAFSCDLSHEKDLAPQHEGWLGKWALETFHSDFLYVEGYPLSKRPFYTHPNSDDPETSRSFDLLFRGQELVTGGQRLHCYDDYVSALTARHLNPERFDSYLMAFRYGMPPHGGFAIGLERFIARLLGIANIRDASLFPRDMTRLTP
ncbi:aspartate--tRNA(Asn) ligase [Sulfobacillus thermosulfidooxidans]|uniref:aspartate--tRNA(Asn) ligase n=1 Tax=Sulfobacillus thermosulfidooxidans TaxID=28034 RepID=UPI0002D5F4AD|nr:aspartate--tRNA(Asn) ligase [Sulfobacillus thermosulfidooxidans]